VKLNLFNYFEKKSKVALNKYEKADELNNEIIKTQTTQIVRLDLNS
jgi:hypothetical protein